MQKITGSLRAATRNFLSHFGQFSDLVLVEIEDDCFTSIVVGGERFCQLDIIIAPTSAADVVLISNPELRAFIPNSLQVACKTHGMVFLDLLVTINAEHVLGFETGAVFVLEFRDLDLSVGAVLQLDSKVLASSHLLSPLKNVLFLLAANHRRKP
ncbi:MAG TPA: hypothetical protein VER76_21095 [Pyrinomonadaceae bacterium]|nr:hypothetical protein [Pyrinomonadaceae bacterium]